jgi:pimeloyl-ACP methyl ester carboxylesterase
VFLLHGFLGNREIWNDLQPLVPRDSIPVERWQAFPGFDGRFDLVAVGSTLARANLARLTDLLETDVALALRRWRPGFAIGRFDAVGFSTGAPLWLRLVQKLVADGRAPPSPIRKLIPFSGAIDGTDLATKLVEVRDELQPLKLDLEWVDPLREGFRGGLTGTLQQKLKPDFCAITVKVLGLHEEFLLRGAVDDLRLGSPALPDPTALFASFARPPGLHFLADANTSNLFGVHTSSNEWGLTNPVVQMWALLGQLCNLTPDESTAETTQLQKDVVGILGVVAGPLRKALAKQGDARLEALAKTLTKVAKSGLKQALEAELPKPVFTGASAVNDRVLPERSQRHAHAANEAFVTSVGADAVDHLQFRSSPRTLADSCLVPLEPRFRTAIDDYNLDDSPDVVCFLLHLLEADPRTPLFLGGGP